MSIAPIEYRTIPILQAEKSYSLPTGYVSYSVGMEKLDPVRELIGTRAGERGQNLASLSKKLRRNHAYLYQFVHKGKPATLPEQLRYELADLLDVEEAVLRIEGRANRAPRPAEPHNARISGPVTLTGKIPAYGQARGGKDGQFVLNGNRIADIVAPPSLASVPDAYAVYVAGDSMEPRYFAGEAVYVHPRIPVRSGDFVVAQIQSGEDSAPDAYVKRFVSMDDKRLRLEQLNPKKYLEFPASKVVSVHRIIMGGDG